MLIILITFLPVSVNPLPSPTFETLYLDHHAWLRSWLHRRLDNSSEASDLAQDTFVNVITTGYVEEIREPRPFLATIARRLLAHRHRRHILESAYLEALAALPPDCTPAPETRLMALQALQEVDLALAGLPPAIKEAFLLAQLEGLTYEQIAARLDVSTSSVKQYLARANRQCIDSVCERFNQLHGAAAYQALSPMRKPASPGRRKSIALLLGLGAAGGAGVFGSRSQPWQQLAADLHTGVGEQREWTLSDGTRVLLNTSSAVNVRFDGDQRLLTLVAGEIRVITGHRTTNEERPLLVQTAEGRVRALGTAFTVRQQDGRTEVAVQQSAVEMTPVAATGSVRLLHAGQRAWFTAADIGPALPASADHAAWTLGAMVADNMRLDDFLMELGRYRRGVLRCDPAVAGLRLSGVFPLKDTSAILAMLPASLPVRIRSVSRYWVTIDKK
ncbi:sigma-70 family RNA polymerase sigma factor [Duganella sp. CY15W]|nr:sigma-70 family RNA polymerase sigma factor [Duganella sp. CY15W]MYM31251.1 sigma-70 family RNA polymerase sigma factor [Duganella sp. CY15W]